MSRGRLAALGALFAVAVAVVSLGLVELLLRVADHPPASFSPWVRSESLGFRLAPGQATRMTGPEYDVEVATNSLGMRDEEPAARPARRILLLGDSFTMGYGVERGELFADRLEDALSVEIINAGTGGYEIIHQVQVLREHGQRLRPDLIVYALYLGNDLAQNDEWELDGQGRLRSLVREYPLRQPREWKLRRLWRDFRRGLRVRGADHLTEWLPFEAYLGLCESSPGEEARKDYELSGSLLGDLATEAKRLDAPLLVLLIPYRPMVEPEGLEALRDQVPDLDARYDLSLPAREIGRRMDALGIRWADMTPGLVEEHRRTGVPMFFPLDGHLNVAGHDAFARLALPVVRSALQDADGL